ncbi:MAG TPA: hypothetical protein VN734_11135, partial [Acidobacteriaceae bacterium]|nr:hypothetical protein [Acidobacteriaceae bacterium]
MNPSVEALENLYFLLRGSFTTLQAHGATPDQLDQLRTQIVIARTNYWTAINSILHDDDPEVRNLTSQLNSAQLSLDATIKHLNDVAKVIDAITKAVDIGSQIVEKA